MFRRHGYCIALCLCFFLLGILIGGCIIGGLPGHNRIHLSVGPNQAISVRPEVGDQIYWSVYGQEARPAIAFRPPRQNPCSTDDTTVGTCHFIDSRPKIFYYTCSATPCDPGVGPGSTTGGFHFNIFTRIFIQIVQILEALVFSVDRRLDLPKTSPGDLQAEAFTPSAQPPLEAPRANPDGVVFCDPDDKTGTASVDTDPIQKAVGDTVYWSGDAFTVKIKSGQCTLDSSGSSIFHNCKIVSLPITYTVTDSSCANATSGDKRITQR
jgi:hypothetical protein